MDYPHVRMAAGAHDRVAQRRRDDAWLEQQWADPRTRVLVVSGTRIRPGDDGDPAWVSPHEAPDGLRVLLGVHLDRARFAVVTGPELAEAAEGEWLPLRGLLPRLADGAVDDAPLVFHALGLAEWLAVTRFCPRCGGHLAPASSGHELVCEACGRSQFPRTDPAVIMLVTSGAPGSAEERCLLGRQAAWPAGRYSTLAGFCEPGETLEDAVRREVLEESGVVVGEVAYFGNQPWPLPASLMVGFTAEALSHDIRVDRDELDDARWFTRSEMEREARDGRIVLPGGVSISRSLVEHWYGGPLPGQW